LGVTGAATGATVCGTGAAGTTFGVELDIAKMMTPTTRNAIIMIASGETLGVDCGDRPGWASGKLDW
jgi:hypothetical protein